MFYTVPFVFFVLFSLPSSNNKNSNDENDENPHRHSLSQHRPLLGLTTILFMVSCDIYTKTIPSKPVLQPLNVLYGPFRFFVLFPLPLITRIAMTKTMKT